MHSANFNQPFDLTPTSAHAAATHEAVVLDIVKNMASDKRRQPLVCITFKQPFHDYERLKAVCQRWHLQYTQVLRFFICMAIAVLVSPSGDLLDQLKQHRETEIEKDRQRKEDKERRAGKHAA